MAHPTVENVERDEAEDECSERFGVREEATNKPYEKVEEEATPTPVDFDAGEKVELAVHFHIKNYDAEHIRSFVLDSPIEGWNVNFRPNPFSSA